MVLILYYDRSMRRLVAYRMDTPDSEGDQVKINPIIGHPSFCLRELLRAIRCDLQLLDEITIKMVGGCP